LTGIDLLRELAEASGGKVRAELLVARSALARQLGHLVDATTDLDQAIAILDNLEDEEGVALAGALCNRGNVFRQRSLYEKSLADYQRSAEILDRLPIGDTSAQLHLATLLVNRGNLLRELARIREAIQDYTAAIDIHRHLFEPSRQVLDSELALALSNRGNARADLNQNDLALEDYAAGLGIYACLIELGQSEFQPQLAHLHVLRGTVLQAQGEHAGSLRALDAGVRVMKELVSSGRNDLEPSLALALMNRSLTLLRLSRHDEALEDSGTAITTYHRLVKAGREDLRGFQAHSLLSGALIRYELGDSAGASECLAEGRGIALPMVRRSEREMLIVYVRYLILIATAIATQHPTQSVALLNEALDEVGLAADDKQTFEALAAPIYALLGPLQSVEPILCAQGLDESRYTHVRKLVCDALE
jgi:tetratricopeptide (TPR) repeat protein